MWAGRGRDIKLSLPRFEAMSIAWIFNCLFYQLQLIFPPPPPTHTDTHTSTPNRLIHSPNDGIAVAIVFLARRYGNAGVITSKYGTIMGKLFIRYYHQCVIDSSSVIVHLGFFFGLLVDSGSLTPNIITASRGRSVKELFIHLLVIVDNFIWQFIPNNPQVNVTKYSQLKQFDSKKTNWKQ